MLKKSSFWLGICLTLFFLLWETLARLQPTLLFILPAPSAIFKTLWEHKERLLFHSGVTLQEMLGGFLFALLLSFPISFIMIRSTAARSLLQPLFIAIQCLPMFTLAPLLVIWMGWGYATIALPTALMILFPLTLSIYQGLKATPQELLEFFKSNQATTLQTFFKLRLPWALSHIFAGLRIGAAMAGIGAIAGEWAGAQEGLGILMLESRRNTDLEMTFSALFALTVMSLGFYGMIALAEKSLGERRMRSTKYSSLIKKSGLSFAVVLFASLFFSLIPSNAQQSQKSRLLLDWLPSPTHIPLYVGVEKGFFASEGIPLTIQKMHENGGGIDYLSSGQVDLLVGHIPSALRAVSRGGAIKVIGQIIDEPLCCLIYHKDTTIHSPQDLSHKTLGYCIGSSDTSLLNAILEEGQVYPLERQNIGVDLTTALATKRIDVLYGGYWNTEPAQLAALGIAVDFFTLTDLSIPTYCELVILAATDSPQTSPTYITSFKHALQNSIDYCRAHPDEAFAIYLRHNKDKRLKTLLWEKASWLTTLPTLAQDQSLNEDSLKDFALWLEQKGIFPSPIPYKNLLP